MDHPYVRRRDPSSLRSLVHIGALAPPVLRERARHRLGPVVAHEQGKPNRVAIAALPRARQLA
jgi:fatty-acyl-CoA synthase